MIAFHSLSSHLFDQARGNNPCAGDCLPSRVPLFATGRPALPFPHLFNYKDPLKIFEAFYHGAEKESAAGNTTATFTSPAFHPSYSAAIEPSSKPS